MRCTSRRRRRRIRRLKRIAMGMGCVILILSGMAVTMNGCSATELIDGYDREQETYNISGLTAGRAAGIAADLCVTDRDIGTEELQFDTLEGAALFDVNGTETIYAKNVHERLYPASTTKILTALIVLKYANLEEVVTLGNEVTGFAYDEQVCGFEPGDVVTMDDLLHGLLLYSGNDAGAAIAVHMSGSVEAFADLMNEEAHQLGATNSHFMNPHGLDHEDHYTTVYDLYLIFQEAISYDYFREIIHLDSYTAKVTGADQTVREIVWPTTNQYLKGNAAVPEGVTVVGGKTGTTTPAGSCLVLLSQDEAGDDYISIILKAENRTILYENMTKLIDKINEN